MGMLRLKKSELLNNRKLGAHIWASFYLSERRPVVAKGKYYKWLEPDNLMLLEAWARNGLTDEQIAENMGISCSTLYDWKNKYSDISESLKRGKEVVDVLVENALFKRALGYEYKEVTKEVFLSFPLALDILSYLLYPTVKNVPVSRSLKQ